MQDLIKAVEAKHQKHQVVDVKSGDTVRVHQKIKEGEKTRVQVFEGVVIRTDRKNSLTSRILVRRIASGVGVEKSFLLHSPLVEKIEVTKRSKVRRNYLSYMRGRAGKSARMTGTEFDKEAVNTIEEQQAEAEEVRSESSEEPEPDETAVAKPAAKPAVEPTKSEIEVEPVKNVSDVSKTVAGDDKAKAKKAKAEAFRRKHE